MDNDLQDLFQNVFDFNEKIHQPLSPYDFNSLFNFPIKEAASRVGMSVSRFKIFCRKQGIPKWPFRRLQSLQKLEDSLALEDPHHARQLKSEIQDLKENCKYNPQIKISKALVYQRNKVNKLSMINRNKKT